MSERLADCTCPEDAERDPNCPVHPRVDWEDEFSIRQDLKQPAGVVTVTTRPGPRPGEGPTRCDGLLVGVDGAEFEVVGEVAHLRWVVGGEAYSVGVSIDAVYSWLSQIRRIQLARGG